jgi:hypothetical protein
LIAAAAGSAGDGYGQWASAVSTSAAYTGGGYNDWRLPDITELNKLYLNRAATGGWTTNTYWSITEFNSSNSYYLNFSNGAESIHPKSFNNNFRAVRSFSIPLARNAGDGPNLMSPQPQFFGGAGGAALTTTRVVNGGNGGIGCGGGGAGPNLTGGSSTGGRGGDGMVIITCW